MVEVPAATPVTSPEALTVATAVLLEDQVPPGVASFSEDVDPVQTLLVPAMAATMGNAFTVTVAVAVDIHPLALVTV
jgi:hypothetical protein